VKDISRGYKLPIWQPKTSPNDAVVQPLQSKESNYPPTGTFAECKYLALYRSLQFGAGNIALSKAGRKGKRLGRHHRVANHPHAFDLADGLEQPKPDALAT
jgi:hypothetical protein